MSIHDWVKAEMQTQAPATPDGSFDPYCIESWAAQSGVSEHAAAIQMAAVLGGVGGPVAVLDGTEAGRDLPPVVPIMVTRDGRRPKSLELLRSTAMNLDAHLRQRFAGFTAEGFRDAASIIPKGRGDNRPREDACNFDRVYVDALDTGGGYGVTSSYDRDWEPDALDRRLRTTLRPGFILENPDPRRLPNLVAACHDSTAFLPGFPLECLLSGGVQAFETFFAFIAGCDVELPPHVVGKSFVKMERGEVRTILTASLSEVATASEVYPGLTKRVILVDASRPNPQASWDEGKAAKFQQVHSSVVQVALDRRRRGHLLNLRDWSAGAVTSIARKEAAFLDACDSSVVPCSALLELPAILRWAFTQIERNAMTSEGDLVELSHRLSLALLEDHVRLLGAAQQRANLTRQLELAEKLVGRISAKQPVRQRDLIRTFDNQKVERYRPVLNQLVEEGVLVEGPSNVFRLGTRQLESVRSRWLGDPALLS